MDSCVSCDSPCSSVLQTALPVLQMAVPIFEELVKHSSYEIELLMEDAKRYIYIAQMICSSKPLKKAKRMIKKIKSKLKKKPHLKTKKIEDDLYEFHIYSNCISPELSKIKKHIKDILLLFLSPADGLG